VANTDQIDEKEAAAVAIAQAEAVSSAADSLQTQGQQQTKDEKEQQKEEALDKMAKEQQTAPPSSFDIVVPDIKFKSRAEREKHAEEVRDEGLKPHEKEDTTTEIDLEIEAPGAANSVAEEGAKTI